MMEPAPKLKSEWVGRRVRLLQTSTNVAGFVFPQGTVMEVTRNFGGVWLESLFLCGSCSTGRKHAISKIPESRVELLPRDYEETFEERMLRAGEWAAGKLDLDAVSMSIMEANARMAKEKVEAAKKVLIDGLCYHEHDGHNMPKSVAREALVVLGVGLDDQP